MEGKIELHCSLGVTEKEQGAAIKMAIPDVKVSFPCGQCTTDKSAVVERSLDKSEIREHLRC